YRSSSDRSCRCCRTPRSSVRRLAAAAGRRARDRSRRNPSAGLYRSSHSPFRHASMSRGDLNATNGGESDQVQGVCFRRATTAGKPEPTKYSCEKVAYANIDNLQSFPVRRQDSHPDFRWPLIEPRRGGMKKWDKSKNKRKLRLSRETLRELTNPDTSRV